MGLKIFAMVVLLVIIAVIIWLAVIAGNLPGKIAREREHPQAEAIAILGWIGLVTLGLGWFVAIVWAHTHPMATAQNIAELQSRLEALENSSPAQSSAETNA